MLKNIDDLAEKIRIKIEKENKKNVVINLLREDHYGTINAITYAESLAKGKIPPEMREDVVYIICKEIGIDDLDWYFTKDDIELGEIKKRLTFLEKNYAKILKIKDKQKEGEE